MIIRYYMTVLNKHQSLNTLKQFLLKICLGSLPTQMSRSLAQRHPKRPSQEPSSINKRQAICLMLHLHASLIVNFITP